MQTQKYPRRNETCKHNYHASRFRAGSSFTAHKPAVHVSKSRVRDSNFTVPRRINVSPSVSFYVLCGAKVEYFRDAPSIIRDKLQFMRYRTTTRKHDRSEESGARSRACVLTDEGGRLHANIVFVRAPEISPTRE